MPPDLTVVPGLDGEPVFAEPWQAQAFAATVALQERGLIGRHEWAAALGAELERELQRDYWQSWLAALEGLLVAKGLAEAGALPDLARRWREAADATPHGAPITLG